MQDQFQTFPRLRRLRWRDATPRRRRRVAACLPPRTPTSTSSTTPPAIRTRLTEMLGRIERRRGRRPGRQRARRHAAILALRPDSVLLDLDLGDTSGIQVLRTVRKAMRRRSSSSSSPTMPSPSTAAPASAPGPRYFLDKSTRVRPRPRRHRPDRVQRTLKWETTHEASPLPTCPESPSGVAIVTGDARKRRSRDVAHCPTHCCHLQPARALPAVRPRRGRHRRCSTTWSTPASA